MNMFLLFKPSPNAFKFCMNSNKFHKKWVMCLIIQKMCTCLY